MVGGATFAILLAGAIALLPGMAPAGSGNGTIRICRAAAGRGAALPPLVIPAGSAFAGSRQGGADGATIRTIGATNFAAKQQCAFAAAVLAAPAADRRGLAPGAALFPTSGDAGELAAVVMQGFE